MVAGPFTAAGRDCLGRFKNPQGNYTNDPILPLKGGIQLQLEFQMIPLFKGYQFPHPLSLI
jgi:hypothetical protein